jgi:hypothetical protein
VSLPLGRSLCRLLGTEFPSATSISQAAMMCLLHVGIAEPVATFRASFWLCCALCWIQLMLLACLLRGGLSWRLLGGVSVSCFVQYGLATGAMVMACVHPERSRAQQEVGSRVANGRLP